MYIDGGEIKEAGSHDELMAKKGYYYDLYMAQYREEPEEASPAPSQTGELSPA